MNGDRTTPRRATRRHGDPFRPKADDVVGPAGETRRELLVRAHAAGLSLTAAAQAAGIGHGTARRWLDDDPDLRERCERAAGQGVLEVAERLRAAALDGEGWALRFFLERRAADFRPPVREVAVRDPQAEAATFIGAVADALGVDGDELRDEMTRSLPTGDYE